MHRQFISSAGMLGLTALLVAHFAYGTLSNEPTDSTRDGKLHPLPIHTDTTLNIVEALSSRHYVSATLDDELSSRIFDAYIKDLDPSRSYLLQSDIDQFEIYRYQMDDTLQRGNIDPAFQIFNRYHERIINRLAKILETLKLGLDQFDFSIDESLVLDHSDESWASK